MPAKVIAVANMKGGVGKTTTVVALAEFLAAYGVNGQRKRVAVVDLDAQASASISIAGNTLLTDLIENEKTIDIFLEDRVVRKLPTPTLKSIVRRRASSLTAGGQPVDIGLVASSPQLRFVEREMIYNLTEKGYGLHAIEGQTRAVVEPELELLRSAYDYILVDCPPGISAFTEVMITASDLILAPVIPDFVSTRGLSAFCQSVESIARGAKKVHVLINRLQNTTHHQDTVAQLKADAEAKDAGYFLLKTMIKQRASIGAALETEPGATFESRWGTQGSSAYRDLAQEIVGRLNA
jgi:chromosome partitioning protein